MILSRISSVGAPSVLRNCREVSPLPCLHAFTWGERGSRLARTISPILRCGSMPSPRNSVKAWTMKSPFTLFQAKWYSSWSPHMLVPDDERSYRSEEHTSELQSLRHLVCRLLLEKKKKK